MGQGGVELAQALPLPGGPPAGVEETVDGLRGVVDRVPKMPRVVHLRELVVVALCVEDLGKTADVKLVCVAAG